MIIHPSTYGEDMLTSMISGVNRRPSVGDDGHLTDHEAITAMLLDMPLTFMLQATAARLADGQWSVTHVAEMGGTDVLPFEELDEAYGSGVGTVVVADRPHDAADGVTNWQSDSPELEGIELVVYPAGMFGTSLAIGSLMHRISMLENPGG